MWVQLMENLCQMPINMQSHGIRSTASIANRFWQTVVEILNWINHSYQHDACQEHVDSSRVQKCDSAFTPASSLMAVRPGIQQA